MFYETPSLSSGRVIQGHVVKVTIKVVMNICRSMLCSECAWSKEKWALNIIILTCIHLKLMAQWNCASRCKEKQTDTQTDLKQYVPPSIIWYWGVGGITCIPNTKGFFAGRLQWHNTRGITILKLHVSLK